MYSLKFLTYISDVSTAQVEFFAEITSYLQGTSGRTQCTTLGRCIIVHIDYVPMVWTVSIFHVFFLLSIMSSSFF